MFELHEADFASFTGLYKPSITASGSRIQPVNLQISKLFNKEWTRLASVIKQASSE
jgi:hypothetical protein